VVTNNHVINNGTAIEITMYDGKTYRANVVGADAKTDVALLKVNGRPDFPCVTFSNTPPRVGDWVLVVGNPFGLGGTVTAGIVSARDRNIGGPYDDYIQIDAPVNKSKSGGPAFDQSGNVIGVTSAIPDLASQSHAVLSEDAVAISVPSGENARLSTGPS
jgi:serine protease Do